MKIALVLLSSVLVIASCKKDDPSVVDQWERHAQNPVLRDEVPSENYESASDPHVFFNDAGELSMVYSGDSGGKSSIKLAKGSSWTDWQPVNPLLSQVGPSGKDVHKETSFYRKANDGKHQLFYIGYADENSYEAEIYLAEADSLEGPYTQLQAPIIPKGLIAGKQVYCMTSPSIVEHEGRVYMAFIGWDNSPNNVEMVWVLGAVSDDDGRTWGEFQEVDAQIGMEGQITKGPDGDFYAVRTAEYQEGVEAIFMAQASHPFGPWTAAENPVLIKAGGPLETDEIIAPQLTFDPTTGKEYLYYTGVQYQAGWWVMLATRGN